MSRNAKDALVFLEELNAVFTKHDVTLTIEQNYDDSSICFMCNGYPHEYAVDFGSYVTDYELQNRIGYLRRKIKVDKEESHE